MEVSIASVEVIKPSSPTHHLKPYKLCIIDQLIPVTYVSIILFYPIADPNVDISKTLTKLKESLSETLNLYYPFSGRTKHNLYVDDFLAGVLFLEARVKCQMSEFFKIEETELQNQLVPSQPFCPEKTSDVFPIAFQSNVFSCGGLALGVSMCHKNGDGATLSNFLNSWAACCSGSLEKVINPNISMDAAAILFPPMTSSLLHKYAPMVDRIWIKEGDYLTRRFVFSAEALGTLKEMAKSERVPNPSSYAAISCFVWKHAMESSWAASGSRRPSLATHAVNLRPRMQHYHGNNLLGGILGNLVFSATTKFDPNDHNLESSTEVKLSELVEEQKGAIEVFNNDFLYEVMKGNKDGSSEILNKIELVSSMDLEKLDVFSFTNWKGFWNEVDFGFGKPFLRGTIGNVGTALRNLVIFVEADQWGEGSVEAIITFENNIMALLESDHNFLAFTSPNPLINAAF
ncbi:Transferase [Trema orientale]|uniref:Transferase n=1 Tax=Trema orientale TaxID=63057 RepID=A0A2P5ACZ1_TREOI|nr:Transferase [Trema orientale]